VRDVCVCAVAVSMAVFGLCYIVQIWRAKAAPPVATWVMFFAGCWISFPTYAFAESLTIETVGADIVNAMDLFFVTAVLGAILLRGRFKNDMDVYEYCYLAVALGIVVFWLATGKSWGANKMSQCLMVAAYVPTISKMIRAGRNTESYFGWVPAIFNSLVGLYPAWYDGKELAIWYDVRAFVQSSLLVLLMVYYDLRKRRNE